MKRMKWFLRSAFAVVSLGSGAGGTFAQDEPPPMMPPVRALPGDEPPGGILGGLPVAPPTSATNTLMRAIPQFPTPAITTGVRAGLMRAPVVAAANHIPAASGPKPAPPETVQWAVSEKPETAKPEATQASMSALPPLDPRAPLAPLAPLNPGEPPVTRPDYLPPAAPPKTPAKPARPSGSQLSQLPEPPSPGPLPAIPIAPPIASVPKPKPGANGSKPAPRGAIVTAPKPGNPEKPGGPTFPHTASSGDGVKTNESIPTLPPSLASRSKGLCVTNNCPTQRVADLCDPVWRLCPQSGPVRFRGWLDGGYVWNTSDPTSKFNGPYNSIDRSNEFMFNQAYGIIDRPLPTDGSFGMGFRTDVLFGYDHFLGQSRGFEVDRDFNQRWNGQYYGLAIPQAYAEAGNDVVSAKVGHFYSPIGYETLPAVGNFFYSHAYSYQFGQPITHWGGLVTTQLTKHWQVQAGAVNGWDTLVGRANNASFIGGLKYTPNRNWWASFTLITGDEQNNVAGLPFIMGTDGNRTRYSFLVGLMPGGPGGRWEYVFHHYYGWQENGTPQRNLARWYGIDQYLYYRVSRQVRLGARFEWFRDEDGTRVGLNRPANLTNPPLPGNYFSLTTGLNYTPVSNLIVRPELRWDFTSDTARPAFNDGTKNNQLLLACDLIWQF
jgi:hypothetical protein